MLAHRFKALRTSKNLSVYKLFKLSKVSENYIRTIEEGDSQASIHVLEKLLRCIGITLPEFFCGGQGVLYPCEFERELIETVRRLPEGKARELLVLTKLLL